MPSTASRSTSGLRSGEHHGTRSECAGCGEVFCGVAPFDDHRVGEHGVREGPNRRRCLTPAEMAARGLPRCRMGRWSARLSRTTRARTAEGAIFEVRVEKAS